MWMSVDATAGFAARARLGALREGFPSARGLLYERSGSGWVRRSRYPSPELREEGSIDVANARRETRQTAEIHPTVEAVDELETAGVSEIVWLGKARETVSRPSRPAASRRVSASAAVCWRQRGARHAHHF
jgi:hypothetical protein